MLMPVVRRALAASAVLLTAATTPAAAQNVIDQQQPTATDPLSSLTYWSAQTFTPAASNVSGAGVFLRNNSAIGTAFATLALWSGNPSIAASQQLASQTVSFNGSSPGVWADAFWSPVAVIPGQTYWLLIGGGPNTTYTTYGPAASYPNGGAYLNGSTEVRTGYSNYTGTYNLTFRTYTSVGATTVTPEPGTWALLGTGLLAMGGLAARRRSAPSA